MEEQQYAKLCEERARKARTLQERLEASHVAARRLMKRAYRQTAITLQEQGLIELDIQELDGATAYSFSPGDALVEEIVRQSHDDGTEEEDAACGLIAHRVEARLTKLVTLLQDVPCPN